ncbi:MAG: hypothetical protein JWL77_3563 [Chthonomonadaceae bacterium]|nr:hypothetical protein [Chthonomonadaceae bacterium]
MSEGIIVSRVVILANPEITLVYFVYLEREGLLLENSLTPNQRRLAELRAKRAVATDERQREDYTAALAEEKPSCKRLYDAWTNETQRRWARLPEGLGPGEDYIIRRDIHRAVIREIQKAHPDFEPEGYRNTRFMMASEEALALLKALFEGKERQSRDRKKSTDKTVSDTAGDAGGNAHGS